MNFAGKLGQGLDMIFLSRIDHGSFIIQDTNFFEGMKLDAKMYGNFEVFPL